MKLHARVWFCLCILQGILTPTFADQNAQKSEDYFTPLSFLKTLLFGKPKEEIQPQPVLVIGTGVGRTGTSSYITAVEMLGLKSYNFARAMFEYPAHAALWSRHAKLIQEGKEGITEELIDALARDGFNSTASMPGALIYKDLMKRYPAAKVIMTVRSDGNGEAWAKSMSNSVGRMGSLIRRPPFRWIPAMRRMRALLPVIHDAMGASLDPKTGMARPDDLARAYENWVEEVKSYVPAENLLVFSPKDGWGPLCEFLSPLDESIKSRCDEILASGIPYPRMNDTASIQRVIRLFSAIATVFEYSPYWISFLCFLWLGRRRHSEMKAKSD